MENKDKIYNQFKEAATKAENKGFDRIDAVWNRVEEKLDAKKERRTAIWWKYTGIAALFLLFMGVGTYLLNNNDPVLAPKSQPENNVTVIDTQKVKEVVNPKNETTDTEVVVEASRKEKDNITRAEKKESKDEVTVLRGDKAAMTAPNSTIITGDSIHFNPVTKKLRVWNSKSDQGEFKIAAEVTSKEDESALFMKDAKFNTKTKDEIEYSKGYTNVKIVTAEAASVTNTYTGTVIYNADGLPMPGVNVMVKGTATGTITDMDGKYQINAKPGDLLTFTNIGLKEKVVKAGVEKNVDVALQDDSQSLQEVVVMGYGSQRKSDVTSSVSVVKAVPVNSRQARREARKEKKENALAYQAKPVLGKTDQVVSATSNNTSNVAIATDEYYNNRFKSNKNYNAITESDKNSETNQLAKETLTGRPNANIAQTLQGQLPGLNITTGSGAPGANTAISIRGAATLQKGNDPLYVINGAIANADAMKKINPNDIESINVLKDAGATSIYGNRGVNGVIIIKTKNASYHKEPSNILQDPEMQILTHDLSSAEPKDPLFILNGVIVKRRKFKNLKPEDLDTVIILKNGSATAMYGDKGSNGVIIIKTKKVKEEEQDKIDEIRKSLEKLGKNGYKEIKYGEIIEDPKKIQIDKEEYGAFEENKFENPATMPLSTFSIDVDKASYTNVRRFINNGQTVPKDAVRVEEMINFFKYSYPQPTGNDPFSINTEYSDAPWNPNHKLLKIGLQGREIATTDLSVSNLVFLIDVSGSMNGQNKLPLLKQSLNILVNQMRKQDRIAIVVYAGAAGLVLPSTSGADKDKIIAALDNLSAGGSTAGGAGIELAYKTAQDNFVKGGNNRVILATDGDFNVGASSDEDMQTLIKAKRKSGVFLTCLGYGMGNYKDSKLETLADKGNGNYAYIDNMQEADRFLDKEFKGSMYAIAKDVKIQIEFNPKHVQSYRLIGYENRKLRDEDFANDTVDAGELGSGHTVTALYEIIPVGVQSDYFAPSSGLKYSQPQAATGNYNNELATIKFRHKKPDEDTSTEIVKTIPNTIVPLDRASADFKFAASVAWFGLKLRNSKLIPNKQSDAIKELAKQGLLYDPEGYRAEFIRLIEMVE